VYLRDGASGLERLEGAFTVAIWDGRSSELLLVNDRYGPYPHYFTHLPGTLSSPPRSRACSRRPACRANWT
jgi:asparagine synthase (glutamine-hydrolysing)